MWSRPPIQIKKKDFEVELFLWMNGWLSESLEFVHKNDTFTLSAHLRAYIVAPLGGDKRERRE